tara:strand:- start:656 stop:1090 length:435 start_codon:yes stop_codon:yes gene_type:complete
MSSEDSLISKSTLSKAYIKKAIAKLSKYAYNELYVLVDFIEDSQECSFGPDYEDYYDPELVGDIEIGADLKIEDKYYSLIHEIGHAILHYQEREPTNLVLLEAASWIEGLNKAKELGLEINEKEFTKQMFYALDLYREVKDDSR